MAYRNGTYIAFDGLDETNPTKSDFKYFGMIKAWTERDDCNFECIDSHEKTDAVRDTSKKITLKSRIQERLRNSKNMLIILSPDTRDIGSMLSFEIEQAVDVYGLPLIIVYTGIEKTYGSFLSTRWPRALTERINNGTAKAIHIPYKQEPIQWAIKQFSINDSIPEGPRVWYTGY